jgi:Uri superfamily endonuclease
MNRSNSLLSSPKQRKVQNNVASGVYVLVLSLARAKRVTVGKLRTIQFALGFYAYVGSALGPGGFKRVARHLDVSAGRNKTHKWHIDHLSAVAEIIGISEITTGDRIECEVARNLALNPVLTSITGFGSSDCRCSSHLFYARHLHDLENAMQRFLDDQCQETSCLSVNVEKLREGCAKPEQSSTHNLFKAANRGREQRRMA